jgi:hypothetical protein
VTFLHDAPVLTPKALALVVVARQRGDLALVQLLCRHGAADC